MKSRCVLRITLALAIVVSLAPVAASADPSTATDACVDPAAAAQIVIDVVEERFLGLGALVDEEVCKKTCRAGYGACRAVVGGSRKCLRKVARNFGRVSIVAECAPLRWPGGRACRREAKEEVRTSQDDAKADARSANGACENYFLETCIETCAREPEDRCLEGVVCPDEFDFPGGDDGTCATPAILVEMVATVCRADGSVVAVRCAEPADCSDIVAIPGRCLSTEACGGDGSVDLVPAFGWVCPEDNRLLGCPLQ
jgi:hypothetical protein